MFDEICNQRMRHVMIYLIVASFVKWLKLTVFSERVWPMKRYMNEENSSWSRNNNLCKYHTTNQQ